MGAALIVRIGLKMGGIATKTGMYCYNAFYALSYVPSDYIVLYCSECQSGYCDCSMNVAGACGVCGGECSTRKSNGSTCTYDDEVSV